MILNLNYLCKLASFWPQTTVVHGRMCPGQVTMCRMKHGMQQCSGRFIFNYYNERAVMLQLALLINSYSRFSCLPDNMHCIFKTTLFFVFFPEKHQNRKKHPFWWWTQQALCWRCFVLLSNATQVLLCTNTHPDVL